MNDKNIVYYHRADMDGEFCREVAKMFLPSDTVYVGWDYPDPMPETPPQEFGRIYIMDLSIRSLMRDPRVVWIDHHKSAIEEYGWEPRHNSLGSGYCIDGVAASRLAYQYLRHEEGISLSALPTKQDYVDRNVIEPLALTLVGEYDVWDHHDPRTLVFQAGLYRDKDSNPYQALLSFGPEADEAFNLLLHYGEVLTVAKANENKGIITSLGFDLRWEGVNFLACNHARFNSLLFHAGLKPHHEALLGFKWDGKNRRWVFSLYQCPNTPNDLDLSQIARKFGGGGHRGACGFECQHLPFLLHDPTGEKTRAARDCPPYQPGRNNA